MRAKLIRIAAVVFGLLISVATGFAHHGIAVYQADKLVTITGAVVELDLVNPHTLIYLDARQSDGTITRWQGELTSPNNLARVGWTRRSLEPGEQITMSGFPAKNGAHAVWIRKILKSNGTELPVGIEGE